MRWGMFFLLPFLFCFTCEAGTQEELKAIAEKYLDNPMILEDHGNHICVYVLNKEKTETVAIDIRSLDLKVCYYFFEKIDGVMAIVWKHSEIEKQEKAVRKNREV